jgi:hypothetical protein
MLYAETPPEEVAPMDDGWAREQRSIEDEAKAATSAMMIAEGKLCAVPWIKRVVLHDDMQVRDIDGFVMVLRTFL